MAKRGTDRTIAEGEGTTIAVRVPPGVAEKIDGLADQSGLSRAQVLRLILSRIPDDILPPGLIEAAAAIRAARGAR